MLKSKLLTLLRSFNEHELERFMEFLQSPYFNRSGKLSEFYQLISKHAPGFNSDKLEKEKLYKALYGSKRYNDATMRELISDTYKLAKTFLAQEQLYNDPVEQSFLKYDWLTDRQNDKLAAEELSIRNELLQKNPNHKNYFRHRWLYELNELELVSVQMRGEEYKLFKDHDLLSHVHAHNLYYLYHAFKSHIFLLSLSRIYRIELDEGLLDNLEALARQYVDKGQPTIDLLFSIYQLVRRQEDSYFFDLETRFLKNDKGVAEGLMVEAGVVLENYCAKKMRMGEEEFQRHVFEIYRFVIENKLYFEAGGISYIFYCNVALRGSELGHHDWLNDFIEKNKINLAPEYREDAYHYSKAHLLFAQKKYKEALRMALLCNLPLFVVKILIRNLIARCQYELNMPEELNNELDTLRHHLNDDKLTEDRKKHLQVFITAMRQLSALKSTFDTSKMERLTTLMETEKGFANKTWFKEKILELERRRKSRST